MIAAKMTVKWEFSELFRRIQTQLNWFITLRKEKILVTCFLHNWQSIWNIKKNIRRLQSERYKKRRSLAFDVDIDSRLIKEQYFDVIEENDISESFEYSQYHFLNMIHEDKYKHSISRIYNDRLENWARYDSTKANFNNSLRSSRSVDYWTRHDFECRMTNNSHRLDVSSIFNMIESSSSLNVSLTRIKRAR
jgi:hypothetical protein